MLTFAKHREFYRGLEAMACCARLLLVGLLLGTIAGPAMPRQAIAADDPGVAIVAWIQSINEAPGWAAQMRGLSVAGDGTTATIENLLISAQSGAVVLEAKGVKLAGYSEVANNGFTARSLSFANGTVKTPGTEIIFDRVAFDDVGIPALAAITYDPAKPFTSLIAAYSALAKTRSSGGRIAEISVVEKFEGNASRLSYQDVSIGALDDGKIDEVRAGPLTLHSPSADPLAEFSVAKVFAREIDLDAFLHAYDPLRYVAGSGDGLWIDAIGLATYSDLSFAIPGVGLTIDSISIEKLRLRQPDESFAPLIDAMMAKRKIPDWQMDGLVERHLGDALAAFGAGRFALDKINVAATGIDQLTLDSFELSDFSADGLGELAMGGFVGAIAGQGAVAIGRFAIGDMVLPTFETFRTAQKQAQLGGDVDVSSMVPQIGFVEASGAALQAIDFPGAALGYVRAEFGKHIAKIPTEIGVEVNDLDIATASIPVDQIRSLISGLGYDRIFADAGLSLNWREPNGTISLDDLHVDIEKFGNTRADAVFTGLTRDAIEHSGDDADLLSDILFDRASITFEDKSVVERSLSMRAELLKIPLDRLKQQLAGALPLMLAFVGNAEKVKEIVPTLQTFIRTPGTLTIEFNPDTPLPFATLEQTIRTRPQSLPGLLSINVTGTPGPGTNPPADDATSENPVEAEDPPQIRETVEPDRSP